MNKVVVIGSGGREHAISQRLLDEKSVGHVYVIPGNPGMELTQNLTTHNIDTQNFSQIKKFVEDHFANLVIIGPEVPLANGMADFLREFSILTVGPSREGARLESSKSYSKEFMKQYNIPTANFESFVDCQQAQTAIKEERFGEAPVIKASGLAGGKGVIVPANLAESVAAVELIMESDKFAVQADEIVVEEQLKGRELSVFALFDNNTYKIIGYACDYKRLKDNNEGPNTGGMGAWTPEDFPNSEQLSKIKELVFDRVLAGLKSEGIDYRGVLFAGLMINEKDINVIEFNVRFGDPETQVIMPILKGDLYEAFKNCATNTLDQLSSYIGQDSDKKAVHIVKVSRGYPGVYGEKLLTNQEIIFQQNILEQEKEKFKLYFAGVAKQGDVLVNSGGRVLGVTGIEQNPQAARNMAYKIIESINFEGQYMRSDIAEE